MTYLNAMAAFLAGPFDDVFLFLVGILVGVLVVLVIYTGRVSKLARELLDLLGELNKELERVRTLREELEP